MMKFRYNNVFQAETDTVEEQEELLVVAICNINATIVSGIFY